MVFLGKKITQMNLQVAWGKLQSNILGGENLHLGKKRDDVCSALVFLVRKLRTWLDFISE